MLGRIDVSLDSFKFSGPQIFHSQLARAYTRRVLDITSLQDRFKYVNALATDGKRRLIIATEEGLIYVFSLTENRIIGIISSDQWLGSIQVVGNLLYAVGGCRSIKGYSLRSLRKVADFPQQDDPKAYASKGSKLLETAISNKIIANVGFGRFKVFDALRKKIIYSFDIATDTLNEVSVAHRTEQPTIINYCVVKSMFKICYLLEDDEHLYFYNYKFHQLLKKIRLFDFSANLESGILLVNSLLLEQDGYLFIILQFSKERSGDKEHMLKTIMYVVRVYGMGEHRRIKVLFFKDLSKLD